MPGLPEIKACDLDCQSSASTPQDTVQKVSKHLTFSSAYTTGKCKKKCDFSPFYLKGERGEGNKTNKQTIVVFSAFPPSQGRAGSVVQEPYSQGKRVV